MQELLSADSECQPAAEQDDERACAVNALQTRAIRSQLSHPASAAAAEEEEQQKKKEENTTKTAEKSSQTAQAPTAAAAELATESSATALDAAAQALDGNVTSPGAKDASGASETEPAEAAGPSATSPSPSSSSHSPSASPAASPAASAAVPPSASASASAAGSDAAAADPVSRRFFVWISDVHNDPFYGVEGSDKTYYGVCNRKVNGTRTPNFTKQDAAQRPLGAYGCDPPLSLWESALIAASREASGAEFVVFTGDSVRHKQNHLLNPIDNVTDIIGETNQMLVDNFARFSADQFVLGTLGNDDSPHDYEINITNMSAPNPWLEKVAARLEYVGALGTRRKDKYEFGGYFEAKVGGLTILSIDTLIYARKHTPRRPFVNDPFGQFRWLRWKLQEASDANEHVWIVGHVPPGLETYGFTPLWHDEYLGVYLDIVQDATLGSVVKAQLFGHVHADEVRVLPLAPPGAGPVLLIGAVSPIFYSNPSFRVVEYDANSGELLNFKVFWANLSTSYGRSGELDWQFGYDLMGTYPSLKEASTAGRHTVLNTGMVKFASSLESSWRGNKTNSEWTHYVDWYKTRYENDLMAISSRDEVEPHLQLSDEAKQRAAKKYFCALNISSEAAFRSCVGMKAASIDETLGSSSFDGGTSDDPFRLSEIARVRHWHSVATAADGDAVDRLVRPKVERF